VWAAYGWEDDPAETTDEMILERLLGLNELQASGFGLRGVSGEFRGLRG